METQEMVSKGKPQRKRRLKVVGLNFVPTVGTERRLARLYTLLLQPQGGTEWSRKNEEDK